MTRTDAANRLKSQQHKYISHIKTHIFPPCGLSEETDQFQTVPVSVGGGVVDRAVALFVSERGRGSALQQELQTSGTQTCHREQDGDSRAGSSHVLNTDDMMD